jgi:hypothetical protein
MRKLLTLAAALVLVAPAYAQQTKTIPHYRKSRGVTLVCQEIWGPTKPCPASVPVKGMSVGRLKPSSTGVVSFEGRYGFSQTTLQG